MARSKKRRSFRPIQVNSVDYRWRFDPSAPDSRLRITHADIKGQTLIIHMIRWMYIDSWVFLGGAYDDILHLFDIRRDKPIPNAWEIMSGGFNHIADFLSIKNNPPTVTNKFVRSVIEYGLQQGWQPETPAPDFKIIWKDSEFNLEAD